MDVELSPMAMRWRQAAEALGASIARDAPAHDVMRALAQAGLLAEAPDALASVVAIEALALQAPSAAVMLAMQATALDCPGLTPKLRAALREGRQVAALELSADAMPQWDAGRVTGAASWVAPATPDGVALLAARRAPTEGGSVEACLVSLADPGVLAQPEEADGVPGLVCVTLMLSGVEAQSLGAPEPLMAGARLRMAAVGLGLGTRALAEALGAVRASGGHDAEAQTVQGLLADAATELDGARLLTQAVAATIPLSLAEASAAKLASTAAAIGAVERATQVVGIDSFRTGHVLARLARDVRALELFAGRTEALRAAVAGAILPPGLGIDLQVR